MCKDDSGALQFGILFRTIAGRKFIKTSVKLSIYPRQLSRVMVILMQRNGTLVNCGRSSRDLDVVGGEGGGARRGFMVTNCDLQGEEGGSDVWNL